MPEVKSLPDSPGWWIQEGADGPVQFRQCDGFHKGIATVGGVHVNDLKPSRWLKVELPTFPQREKAPFRLCWATRNGERLLLSWLSTGGNYAFWRSVGDGALAAKLSELTDIVWITPEYLQDLEGYRE